MLRNLFEWWRYDALPGVKLAILAGIAAGVLGAFGVPKQNKGLIVASVATAGGALVLLALSWIRNR